MTEEEIRNYCNRPLNRPHVCWVTPLLIIFSYELVGSMAAEWLSMRFALSKALLHILMEIAGLIILGRWITILIVRCYQRYAPEHIRRKCRCYPSCSEYAILVFKKYGLVIGGIKTFQRLFFKCGNSYLEDLPKKH